MNKQYVKNAGDFSWQIFFRTIDKSGLHNQKEINRFRSRWGIPENGFSFIEDVGKWQNELYLKSAEIEQVSLSVLRVIRKQAENAEPFSTDNIPNDSLYLSLPIVLYWRELDRLRISFGFSRRWNKAFQHYTLFNSIDDLTLPIGTRLQIEANQLLKPDVITVEIDNNTTKEDYLEFWNDIETMQGQLPPKQYNIRRRTMEHLKRNRLAWEINVLRKIKAGKAINIIEQESKGKYSPKNTDELHSWVRSYKEFLKK